MYYLESNQRKIEEKLIPETALKREAVEMIGIVSDASMVGFQGSADRTQERLLDIGARAARYLEASAFFDTRARALRLTQIQKHRAMIEAWETVSQPWRK